MVDGRTMRVLLDRIAELEKSETELRERVAHLEQDHSGAPSLNGASTAQAVASSSPGPLPIAGISAEPAKTDSAPKSRGGAMASHHMDVSRTALNIRGFGDFGFYGGNQAGQTLPLALGRRICSLRRISDQIRFATGGI